MKRLVISLTVLALILVLSGCATSNSVSNATTANIIWDENSSYSNQTEFAVNEIKTAFLKANVQYTKENPVWLIYLNLDESLTTQAYNISVSENTIKIFGGDSTGLMYGGLEVAEQIRINSDISKVISTEGSPDLLYRGIKFNLPLDMRTPSYTDGGTAAQDNIANMWDLDFWHEYLDELARNRFNVLSLWNLNPFASMVKVPGFEDVALDDVWKTTVEFSGPYKNNATDLVRSEHWENYEVIKKITIDQKIAFWQEVMSYAHNRGIQIYLFTWNIYTFGEQGKYGITNDMDNEITRSYYRAAISQMVKTYPLLKGIGVTAGENMGFEVGSPDGEEWLFSTYGLGIMDGLQDDPEREFTFFHRLHYSDFDTVKHVWADFTKEIEFTDKSSVDHVLSTTTPIESVEKLANLPQGSKMRFELKTDDNYHFKWGDSDHVREYTKNVLSDENVVGFFLGNDGYITAREVTAKNPQSPRELFIKQHWIEHMLFSRIGYDHDLDDKRISQILSDKYSDRDGEMILSLLKESGKIIPLQNQLVWFSGDSSHPEIAYLNPQGFGYYSINNAIKSTANQPGSNVISIVESANNFEDGIPTPEGLLSAFDVASLQKQHANKALDLIAQLKKQKTKVGKQEFELFLQDQEAIAYLGLYYGYKNSATLNLRLYNNLKDESYHKLAIEDAKQSYEAYKNFALIYDSRFTSEYLAKIGFFDVNENLKNVEKDITVVQNWKIRPLRFDK